jgi:hypothetical protein
MYRAVSGLPAIKVSRAPPGTLPLPSLPPFAGRSGRAPCGDSPDPQRRHLWSCCEAVDPYGGACRSCSDPWAWGVGAFLSLQIVVWMFALFFWACCFEMDEGWSVESICECRGGLVESVLMWPFAKASKLWYNEFR